MCVFVCACVCVCVCMCVFVCLRVLDQRRCCLAGCLPQCRPAHGVKMRWRDTRARKDLKRFGAGRDLVVLDGARKGCVEGLEAAMEKRVEEDKLRRWRKETLS